MRSVSWKRLILIYVSSKQLTSHVCVCVCIEWKYHKLLDTLFIWTSFNQIICHKEYSLDLLMFIYVSVGHCVSDKVIISRDKIPIDPDQY